MLLQVLRFGGLTLILSLAACQDLTRSTKVTDSKGRTFISGVASNRLWWYIIIGGLFICVENALYFNLVLLVMEVGSILVAVVLAMLLYGLHGWGGADAKAFIVIGISAPVFPIWGLFYPLPLPLAVLFISCILAVSYALLKPSSEPLKQRHVRFLPFMFVGLVISLIL